MARIFVLEDDKASKDALKEMLYSIMSDITVDTAGSLAEARQLLDSTVSFDLFLLDVNLDKDNGDDSGGITFAKEVRSLTKYEFTPIVMITSITGLEMEAYRKIYCYQYILKPYNEAEVVELVRKVLSHIPKVEKPFIIVKKNGVNYKIFCKEIVFCKAIPRGVCLYLKDEQMEIPYLSIRQLLDKLTGQGFFQCHRMFVVNMAYVRYYDLVNQMIQLEGYSDCIDIGVTYKAGVRRMFK